VLGQEWLWMRKAKISFERSPKTYVRHAKIVIDGMSIPLIEENSNKDSSGKNDPHKSDLSMDEITNMVKKLSLRSEDNKYQKKQHGIFRNIPPVSPTHRKVHVSSLRQNKRKKNKVKYSTDSDTSSNSDTSDSSDSFTSSSGSEDKHIYKTASAKKRPIKRRRCKVKRKIS
jgi:hypothetical protein